MADLCDLPIVIDDLGAAEQRQTDAWLTMIELQDALGRTRRQFHVGAIPMERFMDCAIVIEHAYQKALDEWRSARDEAQTLSATVDGLLS